MSGRLRARRTPTPATVRTTGLRTCVGCRARDERSMLLRVVALPGNDSGSDPVGVTVLAPDERVRLPGRGAWLHPSLDCLDKAIQRRTFARALRLSTSVDATRVRTWITQQHA